MSDISATRRPGRREDPRDQLTRAWQRYEHRDRDDSSFWQSLGVLGAVGWPIVIAAVGGALAGRWLHAQWSTGSWLTALLVAAGAALGLAVAWQLIQPRGR